VRASCLLSTLPRSSADTALVIYSAGALVLQAGVSYGPLCSPWGLALARPPLVCAGWVLGCAGEI
jgi:hypothetical protein